MKLPQLSASAFLRRLAGICLVLLLVFSVPVSAQAQLIDDERHQQLLDEISELEKKTCRNKSREKYTFREYSIFE
ncbi:hypothetical protein LRY65_04545 [Candidatus Woesebacteria bacterium]|nr:hypothetical protein [Candidatus Woesebacteria bacterium]